MAGIVANLPHALASTLELGRTGAISTVFIIIFLVMSVAVVAFIVFMERAQRRILVQYPKRQMGNKMFGGDASHLPLKINTSGVIPPIFASSLLLLPATVANFEANGQGFGWIGEITAYLAHGRPLYMALYVGLIVFFCFFYTAIVFNPDRDRGQSAEIRRVHSRDPAREEYRRLSGLYPDPIDRRRRRLSLGGVHPPRDPDLGILGPVLFRRNQSVDRRQRHDGYRGADPLAPARPSI